MSASVDMAEVRDIHPPLPVFPARPVEKTGQREQSSRRKPPNDKRDGPVKRKPDQDPGHIDEYV